MQRCWKDAALSPTAYVRRPAASTLVLRQVQRHLVTLLCMHDRAWPASALLCRWLAASRAALVRLERQGRLLPPLLLLLRARRARRCGRVQGSVDAPPELACSRTWHLWASAWLRSPAPLSSVCAHCRPLLGIRALLLLRARTQALRHALPLRAGWRHRWGCGVGRLVTGRPAAVDHNRRIAGAAGSCSNAERTARRLFCLLQVTGGQRTGAAAGAAAPGDSATGSSQQVGSVLQHDRGGKRDSCGGWLPCKALGPRGSDATGLQARKLGAALLALNATLPSICLPRPPPAGRAAGLRLAHRSAALTRG